MNSNLSQVLDRDYKLNELDDRASVLQNAADNFRTTSTKMKRKYWLQNLKFKIMIGVFGVGFLTLLLYWAFN